jgi:hypothetical protein
MSTGGDDDIRALAEGLKRCAEKLEDSAERMRDATARYRQMADKLRDLDHKMQDLLRVLQRVREQTEALNDPPPPDLFEADDDDDAVGDPPLRWSCVEFISEAEMRRFQVMPPISADDLILCDWDDLARSLFGEDLAEDER